MGPEDANRSSLGAGNRETAFLRTRGVSGGRGLGTHFDNLLLLFLLRLFAAPGLSLFLGGHCGDRSRRPDLSAAGLPQGLWPRGRKRRKTRAAVAAAPHVKLLAHAPPECGLCDRLVLQSIVGSEERNPEANLRLRLGSGGPGGGGDETWENARYTCCRSAAWPLLDCRRLGHSWGEQIGTHCVCVVPTQSVSLTMCDFCPSSSRVEALAGWISSHLYYLHSG